ncbi:formyl transferase [Nocardiopsis sp. HNM0947]|uniref:Formyl transferase n=1 Tax=Nocardiopsis coralli TaxID=2772213 RepID=A0ABR9P1K5_9ACTN|nr:formyltransferase family protein [Nocardiopsis coralli]MBE2997635.1 formyl transferase [Nocardiopsis coralli]
MQRRYCYVSGLRLGVPALEELCAQGRPPSLVVSYPAELAHRCGYTDYEDLARSHGVPHLRAADVGSDEARDALTAHGIDLMVVAGWSQQIPEPVLEALPLGAVGLHPAPLPVGRGRAPIPWTILRDMRSSAVTLFHLDGGDPGSGDVVDQRWFEVDPDVTATGLYERVGHIQAELLVHHLDDLLAGTAPRRAQSGHASVWPRRRPSDGLLDLSAAGRDVDRMVRALAEPYPGAFVMFGDARVTLCDGTLSDVPGGAPGEIVSAGPGRAWGVTCGDGTVFVPGSVRVDEGVRADPASLAMFRPGAFFDEPAPHMVDDQGRAVVPGQASAADALLRA